MGRRSQSKKGDGILVTRRLGTWDVKWHPDALSEKRAIVDAKERVAIAHAIEKLQVDGPALRSPHQSAVRGSDGAGLRELRPRRGRSRYRPIYSRYRGRVFAILAIGPEAEIDKVGYERAVRRARERLEVLERASAKE